MKQFGMVVKIRKFKVVLSSFVMWLFSICAFLVESHYFGKEMVIGQQYTQVQNISFLVTIGIGVMSFIVFGLSFLIVIWRKSKVLAVSVISLMLTILVSGIAFIMGASISQNNRPKQVSTVPTFTGQELFDAVNTYRMEKEISVIKLDPVLCNNLAQRYFDIRKGVEEGVAHKGIDEWREKFVPKNYNTSEDFAWGKTPQELIAAWEGSPGHRLSILDPKNILGCAYAAEGYGVIELGYKVSTTQRTGSNSPSRTGQIISYHEWCENKDINIYENELITKKSTEGKIYTMTAGDWDCYENSLK